jgi:UDP-N-acetylmuramoylalanine--D-glutamate ligase
MDFQKIFQNKSVLILGLAKTGLSVFFTLKDLGCKIKCFDDNINVLNLFAQEHGDHYKLDQLLNLDELGQYFDYIVASPGFTLSHAICKKALEIGILISDLDLLYLKNPNAFYIGLTGTDGKSTTCSMIAEVLKAHNVNYEFGGNIGVPALNLAQANLYVLEISSFQLDLTHHLRLDISILLNIHNDHLDHYKTLDAYAKSKEKIFKILKPNATSILCINDELCLRLLNVLPNTSQKNISIFKPFNAFESLHQLQNDYQGKNNLDMFYIKNKRLLHSSNIEIANFNNLNFISFNNDLYSSVVYFCALELNLTLSTSIMAIKAFSGLNHRIQKIIKRQNVTFINDSKATNIAACCYALENFQNIFWLAGGICHEEENLTQLISKTKNIKKAYFFGKSAKNLLEALSHYIECNIFETLEEAFVALLKDTKQYSKECIALLSPACKSFDQFKNFEHRGKTFINLCLKYQNY